jgi:hypothetical protein
MLRWQSLLPWRSESMKLSRGFSPLFLFLFLFLFVVAGGTCNQGYCSAASKIQNGLVVLKTDEKTQFNKTAVERHFEMTEGTALIEPKQQVDVQMKNAFVKAGSGAVVLMSMKDGVGCVTNLCEEGDRTVEVRFGDCSLRLSTGRQVWFAATESEIASAVKDEAGRPGLLRQHQTANVGMIAEFSISPATMLESNRIVESMKSSTDSTDRKLYNRIIKASAALTMLH